MSQEYAKMPTSTPGLNALARVFCRDQEKYNLLYLADPDVDTSGDLARIIDRYLDDGTRAQLRKPVTEFMEWWRNQHKGNALYIHLPLGVMEQRASDLERGPQEVTGNVIAVKFGQRTDPVSTCSREKRMPRPKLDFVTIARLWRPSWAQHMIEVRNVSNNGQLKPYHFKFDHHPDTTEAEKYTMALIRLICDVGFGATGAKNYPAKKLIWNANAVWVRFHVPIGKGLNYVDLANLAALYSQHSREDIGQLSK